MDPNNTSPAPAPQPTGPVMDIQAPKPAEVPPAPASTTPPVSGDAKPLKAPPKKGRTPVGVILVAILVAISLGALTVFAYMKTKDEPTLQKNSPATTQTDQKATTSDVDSTTQGIDESMKSMDDATDFNDADLSDSNLGL